MLQILVETLPFFAIVGLGYGAGRAGFFPEQATIWLTKFVFYFALSAMLFRFAAKLSLTEVFDARFIGAYLWGTGMVYLLVAAVAFLRRRPVVEAAIEAQCAAVGNVGFLGIPMLVALLGPHAIGAVIMVLSTDLIVFGSLIVIVITAARDGRMSLSVVRAVGGGLVRNPMIVSTALGLAWSVLALPIPGPIAAFLALLGGAATPGALFAIGASLVPKTAERMEIAEWLAFAKLVLHPAAVALGALVIFHVEPSSAGVMIAAAALPTAGNVYMLAQHYDIAPMRVSAAILVSTLGCVATLSVVIILVSGLVQP